MNTAFDAFPNAPIPATLTEALALLEETRRLLAEECRRWERIGAAVATTIDRLTAERDHAREAATMDSRRLMDAAKHHAREVIWSWMNEDKFVPQQWTAAHPPDNLISQVLAEVLGDDGFTMYSESFRAAWAAEVEAIADAREVRHGSGRVKI